MMNALGASVNDPTNYQHYFYHNDKKVYVIFDICHMVKLMRNCLASYKLLLDVDGQEVKWEYIEMLYKLQETEGLVAGNKLKKQHIEWYRQKMKVRLAVQTLSRSVGDALTFLKDDLNHLDFKGAGPTIKFIYLIDRLFDICNSRSPYGKGFKSPMRASNEDVWKPFIDEAITYILQMRTIKGELMIQTKRKTPFIGFALGAKSLVGIYEDLVLTNRMNYLLTYKCSQDHLEIFFCAMRCRNDWNNNPSCLQFKHSYKRLLVHAQVRGIGGNCIPLDLTTILPVCSKENKHSPSDDVDMSVARKYGLTVNVTDDHDYDMTYSPSLSEFSDNVVSYIAEYVVKMLNKKIHCEECLEAIFESSPSTNDDGLKLFNRKNRGPLICPSIGVRQISKKCEQYVRQMMTITNY